MNEDPESTGEQRPVTPMGRRHRRVLGTLVEKAFCTPDQYPLTVNALVSGCNQKSNRDPVTNYEADAIDETLLELQHQGLVTRVMPATGRTERFRHNLKEAWGLERAERAVVAELLLRGPQTEGELRGRASRMVELASLEILRQVLENLTARGFVRRLTPEGQKRGVLWTHLFYSPDELTRIVESLPKDLPAEPGSDEDSAPSAARGGGEVRTLESRVRRLEEELAQLRSDVERWMGQGGEHVSSPNPRPE